MLVAIILVILLGWILPVSLRIDTDRELYQIGWAPLIRIRIIAVNDFPMLNFRVLFWSWNKDPFIFSRNKKEKGDGKSKKKNKPDFSFTKFQNILWSFRIKEFEAFVFPDNYLHLSWMYPFVFWINRRLSKGIVHIDYSGHNALRLHMTNTLSRLIIAFLKPIHSHKKN